ncbi:MAG: tRNA adenosine(34) deaminase TadA [Pseudomonadales bacterium]|nr:tRNA adenosine(34) deaminase TadA [Pseudomonadales bacterium]MCP5215410.1 tRNA adenosine(34) deaminase TadA [Pseudomonadales bacterium]
MNSVITDPNHEKWMGEALALARQAEHLNEVPVGAIVVKDDQIVGRGFNQPISTNDPTAHAEMMALREAAKHLGNYRLVDCTLYVTIEPCTMCTGAMVHARIKQLVYGARELKSGAIESNAQLLDAHFFNHKIDWLGGVLSEECSALMSQFFKRRRDQVRKSK